MSDVIDTNIFELFEWMRYLETILDTNAGQSALKEVCTAFAGSS